MKCLIQFLTCLILSFASFAKNPVVFLHGYQLNSSFLPYKTAGISTWEKITDLLVSDAGYSGDNLFIPSYYSDEWGFTNDSSIQEIAYRFAQEITELSQDLGNQPVDIVGHSMGGLIVRAMLTYNMIDKKYLGKFITLATPHYG